MTEEELIADIKAETGCEVVAIVGRLPRSKVVITW